MLLVKKTDIEPTFHLILFNRANLFKLPEKNSSKNQKISHPSAIECCTQWLHILKTILYICVLLPIGAGNHPANVWTSKMMLLIFNLLICVCSMQHFRRSYCGGSGRVRVGSCMPGKMGHAFSVGTNLLANRLNIPINKIDITWLNLSFESYKPKCQPFYFHNDNISM